METSKFQSLIQSVTGRDFTIQTTDAEILPETEYYIVRTLPITGRNVGFYWKTAKTEEKMLRSFITAFTSKYREPNPASYEYYRKTYGDSATWEGMTAEKKEYAYYHHASHMFSKDSLLKQVQSNFEKPEIETVLIQYGFYETEYGIGIFALWATEFVVNAINKMKAYLQAQNMPFKNEFSDARWVYRFRLEIDKVTHSNILKSFHTISTNGGK